MSVPVVSSSSLSLVGGGDLGGLVGGGDGDFVDGGGDGDFVDGGGDLGGLVGGGGDGGLVVTDVASVGRSVGSCVGKRVSISLPQHTQSLPRLHSFPSSSSTIM